MSIKRIAAIAIFSLSLGVPTSQALATTPEGDPAGGKFPVSATATSPESTLSLTNGLAITCSNGTGSGQATSKTTGEGSYILHGCKEEIFGIPCTSAGQPGGTIKLETAVLHLVYLDEAHKLPGVLATPPASGVFAKFSCGGFAYEVKGNGVLGRIASPACGGTSTTSTVATEIVEKGKFRYTQVEETGTTYGLTVNGVGAATTWTVTATSAEKGTLTCP